MKPPPIDFGKLPKKLVPVMTRIMRLPQPQHTNAVDDLRETLAEVASFWEAQHD